MEDFVWIFKQDGICVVKNQLKILFQQTVCTFEKKEGTFSTTRLSSSLALHSFAI